ncbi:MAG: PIG-L family deacetylase [Planctomycetes bacterium]|nr:PIG-L family deacetylase [Planctomycetota bacterium]
MSGRFDVLCLSPHLDDVALSMAATLREHVSRGQRVMVATLFSHAGARDAGAFLRKDYPLRRAEDEAACRMLGASVIHGALHDAPFRGTGYRDLPGLCFARNKRQATDQRKATALVQTLVKALRPRRVYAPLGVGEHIDHRLTHNAARALDHGQLWFYEDRPYAFVRHATALRLWALGMGEFEGQWLDEFEHSLRAAPMLAQMDPTQVQQCLKGFAMLAAAGSTGRRLAKPQVKRFAPKAAGFAQRVFECHASQVQGIVGGTGKYATLAAKYARQSGYTGYIERFWRLP